MPSESAIYVVFRGSTSIADWVNNLDAVLTDYPRCSKCKVHKGFYKAQQSVISYITSSVQALRQKYPSYTVIVTGHSLGAAVATLTAIDLQESGMGAVRLFNFGSPRVRCCPIKRARLSGAQGKHLRKRSKVYKHAGGYGWRILSLAQVARWLLLTRLESGKLCRSCVCSENVLMTKSTA
jgi:pimeloyl-ACP methyl ester carboxylesterase